LKLLLLLAALVAIAVYFPPVRSAIDRVRFPRQSFSVAIRSEDYAFDSSRDSLTKSWVDTPTHAITVPFRLNDSSMDRLYEEAIAARLFDTGPPRRIERVASILQSSPTMGFVLRSKKSRHGFSWSGDDLIMRDYKDRTWDRILHFRASLDSMVRAEKAYRDLPPRVFYYAL
jgi:hypothetical protein